MPSLVPEYKVETLYSGTGTVPEFWRGYQEKRCVHIGARRRIEPGQCEHCLSLHTPDFNVVSQNFNMVLAC